MNLQKTGGLVLSCMAIAFLTTACSDPDPEPTAELPVIDVAVEEPQVPVLPVLPPAPVLPPQPSLNGQAHNWVSRLLRNAPSTINGKPYSVNGKSQSETFTLSVINPSGLHDAKAYVDCFTAAGQHQPRYTAIFELPPRGAHTWDSSSVEVPESGEDAEFDVDTVWCAVGADMPIVAFGLSRKTLGSEVEVTHFSLEPAVVELRE